jgi:hypothetical protein
MCCPALPVGCHSRTIKEVSDAFIVVLSENPVHAGQSQVGGKVAVIKAKEGYCVRGEGIEGKPLIGDGKFRSILPITIRRCQEHSLRHRRSGQDR